MLPRSVRLALYFVVGLMLGASVTFAHAGYALPSPPPGFTVTSAGYMYRAPAGVAAVNGAFQTGVSVNVAGKAVTVPAAMRFAANAGQFAASALRLNPYLAVGAVAVWAGGLIYDYETGQWKTEQQLPPESVRYRIGTAVSLDYTLSDTPAGACSSYAYFAYSGGGAWALSGSNCLHDNASWYNTHRTLRGSTPINTVPGSCPAGTISSGGFCIGQTSASDNDWIQLGNQTLPFDVAEPISRVHPLPIQSPQLEPVTAPLSDPYLDPVTGQPYRDMVRISPSPTSENPFRVRVDPYKQPVSSLQPDADAVTPTEQTPVETLPDQHTFCEQFPDASACAKLGSGADPGPVEEQAVDVTAIQPVSIGATGGTCPADRVMQTQFGTLAFEWATLCAFAEGVRPVILAMAWLVAGFGFFYGAKRSQ